MEAKRTRTYHLTADSLAQLSDIVRHRPVEQLVEVNLSRKQEELLLQRWAAAKEAARA